VQVEFICPLVVFSFACRSEDGVSGFAFVYE